MKRNGYFRALLLMIIVAALSAPSTSFASEWRVRLEHAKYAVKTFFLHRHILDEVNRILEEGLYDAEDRAALALMRLVDISGDGSLTVAEKIQRLRRVVEEIKHGEMHSVLWSAEDSSENVKAVIREAKEHRLERAHLVTVGLGGGAYVVDGGFFAGGVAIGFGYSQRGKRFILLGGSLIFGSGKGFGLGPVVYAGMIHANKDPDRPVLVDGSGYESKQGHVNFIVGLHRARGPEPSPGHEQLPYREVVATFMPIIAGGVADSTVRARAFALPSSFTRIRKRLRLDAQFACRIVGVETHHTDVDSIHCEELHFPAAESGVARHNPLYRVQGTSGDLPDFN